MQFADARKWFEANDGGLRVMQRTTDAIIYQIVIGPHVSDGIGIGHRGRQAIPESDPDFQRAFVRMVESVKAKVEG